MKISLQSSGTFALVLIPFFQLIFLYLSTGCFMEFSLYSSHQANHTAVSNVCRIFTLDIYIRLSLCVNGYYYALDIDLMKTFEKKRKCMNGNRFFSVLPWRYVYELYAKATH